MLYFSFSIHNRHFLLYFYKIIFYTLLSAENARFMFGKKRRPPPCDLRKPFQFLERMFAFIISIALYLVKRIPTVIHSFMIYFVAKNHHPFHLCQTRIKQPRSCAHVFADTALRSRMPIPRKSTNTEYLLNFKIYMCLSFYYPFSTADFFQRPATPARKPFFSIKKPCSEVLRSKAFLLYNIYRFSPKTPIIDL